MDPDQDMYFIDNEPFMTLDQFTAYRAHRIITAGIARPTHPLVQSCRYRGQNIQDYVSRLGYTLPIPLVRSLARTKRTLSPHFRRHKPTTELTGNRREDLLVRGLAKYRREAIKGYNRVIGISVQAAKQVLDTWLYMDHIYGFSPQSAAVEQVEPTEPTPSDSTASNSSTSESRALVLYQGDAHATNAGPYVRTYSDRVAPHEPLYPEAPVRYTRALLSMLRDRFPAWDRWYSDERRFAANRHLWASYDAETARLEREAREVQETLAQRRRMERRNVRQERLRIAAVPDGQGVGTRMDRDEQTLIEQAQLDARIQQFRALVYAPPVQLPTVVTIPAVRDVAVVPISPPPAYHSQAVSQSSRSVRSPSLSADSVYSVEATVLESPPRLPAYQPNTYRRGISPPPPPPFNARSDAIPVPYMSRAPEPPTSRWSVGRRLTFGSGVAPELPRTQSNAHPESSTVLEAPIAVRSRNIDGLLFTETPVVPVQAAVEPLSNDVEEDEDEVEHELNDLLSEVGEEDVQEQAQGDAGRVNARHGCFIM